MIKLDRREILQKYCAATKKFGIYISFDIDNYSVEEILKACPIFNFDTDTQILFDGIGFLIFDTQEEMEKIYDQIVGDDGPTKFNSYSGPAAVYALTCDNNGEFLNENT